MTLRDRDILELNALCNSLIDETASEVERDRLSKWILDSEDARQFYIRAMDLSASLGDYAGEMQMDARDLPATRRRYLKLEAFGWLALAASIVAVTIFWTRGPKATIIDLEAEYVGKITGVSESVWSGELETTKLGTFINRSERLELTKGFAEVTFDSGAVVVVEGPATLDVNSPWDATLHRGAIRVNVPKQAIGFRVSNPAVEVTDLGTEFSMVADGQGTANVRVIQGEVEAVSRSNPDREAILLRTNESRSFAVSSVSSTELGEPSSPHPNMPNSFERNVESTNYVLWACDEAEGRVLRPKVVGLPEANYELNLTKRGFKSGHGKGFRSNGIHFDGKLFAKANFPQLSSSFPRTVAFWVKVPKDAALSEAYSMLAWRADSTKLGSRPVHISWNRNPDEGLLGALRTDFSGGHAMGMTSLRDGLWHYVSVVFVPGKDPDLPVQVKQYVDGKLESNRVTPGPKLSLAGNRDSDKDPGLADVLWLGCRLGSGGPKKARFRGYIDELIITNRSLAPGEIAQLMDGEQIALPNL